FRGQVRGPASGRRQRHDLLAGSITRGCRISIGSSRVGQLLLGGRRRGAIDAMGTRTLIKLRTLGILSLGLSSVGSDRLGAIRSRSGLVWARSRASTIVA